MSHLNQNMSNHQAKLIHQRSMYENVKRLCSKTKEKVSTRPNERAVPVEGDWMARAIAVGQRKGWSLSLQRLRAARNEMRSEDAQWYGASFTVHVNGHTLQLRSTGAAVSGRKAKTLAIRRLVTEYHEFENYIAEFELVHSLPLQSSFFPESGETFYEMPHSYQSVTYDDDTYGDSVYQASQEEELVYETVF